MFAQGNFIEFVWGCFLAYGFIMLVKKFNDTSDEKKKAAAKSGLNLIKQLLK